MTLALGIGIALGIAVLVGLVFPAARVLWTGWKYAGAVDRADRVLRASLIPAGCDFTLARIEIARFFEMTNQEAQRQGAEAFYAPEIVAAWKAFADDPNHATGTALCRAMPSLVSYFVECSPGGSLFEIERVLKRPEAP